MSDYVFLQELNINGRIYFQVLTPKLALFRNGLLFCAASVIRADVDHYHLKLRVPCLEDGRFYRNPRAEPERVWTISECSKYYLCLGE